MIEHLDNNVIIKFIEELFSGYNADLIIEYKDFSEKEINMHIYAKHILSTGFINLNDMSNIENIYIRYKTNPTMEALKVLIDDVDNDVLKTSIVDSLRNAWQHRESPDLEFVKEKSLEFCKNQVVKNAIMESVELLESQRYDEIKTNIDNEINES